MKKIVMVDLYAQYKTIKKEIDGAIKDVIKKSAFIGGEYVEKLEVELAKKLKAKYCVALNSGTDALYLSLEALGIKSGDEVITTAFTFFATAEVIARLGAKVVFVDIDPKTFNIDVNKIEEKITKRTKAIIPVHIFGQVAQMDKIMKLAKKYDLKVIEDACQAIGAKYKDKYAGTFGDTGCFSFFPSKNLGAWGDGGAIITNSLEVAEKIKMMRNHGSKIKYFNDEIGYSSRLDGIQAAILGVKLKHIDKWNKERQRVGKKYDKLLGNDNFVEGHVFHQYTFRVKDGKRDELRKYLTENNISSMIYYPLPINKMKPFLGQKCNLPETEKACREVISLPIYPELSNEKIEYICKKIKLA